MYLLTYVPTSWSRVLLEKLTGSQLVKKFPAFYGTRRFITAFTSGLHLLLSCGNSIKPILPHPTSWRSSQSYPSIYSCVSQVVSFAPVYASPIPHTRYMPRSSHSSRFFHPNNIGWGVQIIKLLISSFSPLPCYLVPLRPKYSSQHLILKHIVPPSMWATKFHTHTKQLAKL